MDGVVLGGNAMKKSRLLVLVAAIATIGIALGIRNARRSSD